MTARPSQGWESGLWRHSASIAAMPPPTVSAAPGRHQRPCRSDRGAPWQWCSRRPCGDPVLRRCRQRGAGTRSRCCMTVPICRPDSHSSMSVPAPRAMRNSGVSQAIMHSLRATGVAGRGLRVAVPARASAARAVARAGGAYGCGAHARRTRSGRTRQRRRAVRGCELPQQQAAADSNFGSHRRRAPRAWPPPARSPACWRPRWRARAARSSPRVGPARAGAASQRSLSAKKARSACCMGRARCRIPPPACRTGTCARRAARRRRSAT